MLSLSCSGGGRGGGGWWVGEVCRSGEGLRDIAGNGTVGQHVRCVLVHHSECLSLQATFTFWVLISLSAVNVECDPASHLCVQTRLSVLIFSSAVRPFNYPDCTEGSEKKHGNITGKTASAVLCGSWHC